MPASNVGIGSVMPLTLAYSRPATVREAAELVAADTLAIAGGALLLGQLDLPYRRVVDLRALPDLRVIAADAGTLRLGAAAFLQEVVESDAAPPDLKASLTRALGPNLRQHASVGESLLADAPPGEWIAALAALEARVERVDAAGTATESPVAQFLTEPPTRRRAALVTAIMVPLPGPDTWLGAAFVARTPADKPIVCAAVRVTRAGDGRVASALAAIAGASPAPVMALRMATLAGQPLDEPNIASAVKQVAPAVNPVSDFLGSAEYRREMARVTVARALRDVMARVR